MDRIAGELILHESCAFLITDIDDFKKVNDSMGHHYGDEVIKLIADRIERMGSMDATVARFGGDEFAAILENRDYDNREALLKLFDEKVAEEHFEAGGDTLTVSVARGLGVYDSGMEFSAVAKRADVAMYNHKSALKAKFGEDVR